MTPLLKVSPFIMVQKLMPFFEHRPPREMKKFYKNIILVTKNVENSFHDHIHNYQ